MNTPCKQSWSPFQDSWALALEYFPLINGGSFICSSSSGTLALFALNGSPEPSSINRRAHDACINAVEKIDEFTLASASSDGVKIWDLRQGLHRAQAHLKSGRNSTFLSLGSKDGRWLAAGTELLGADAELHLWDLQSPQETARSFVDSHHDDITAVQFHKTLPYLMSGSTDGYVNIYNLDEPDEDEALHQVINFASVHSCSFVTPGKIAVLSHMETLAFWELNNTNYEADEEARPRDLGDVRQIWPECEYVVDLYKEGYVCYGANSMSSMTVMPFDADSEQFDVERAVKLTSAHGEEVVRDALFIPGTSSLLTCGEDGMIKAWELPWIVGAGKDIESGSVSVCETGEEEAKEKRDKRDNKERKDKKERKERKAKKEKKDKKDKKKSKKDVRFKPY